jgi:hypothetical protein
MLSWEIYTLCKQSKTVTSELAQQPSQCPGTVFKELYEKHHNGLSTSKNGSGIISAEDFHGKNKTQRAHACGNWGLSEPSELFLQVSDAYALNSLQSSNIRQVYHDALCSLEKNPIAGVVSPPVMGSTGVVPLTIIAPLPDLCRHLANCIVRAKHEVFLGTNFWVHSDAATLVTNAIRELSKRAGQEGRKVIMKMVYDRGDPRQVPNCESIVYLYVRLMHAPGLRKSIECS